MKNDKISAYYRRPTLMQRVWQTLGFGYRPDEDIYRWRTMDPQEHGFANACMHTETHVVLDWKDRLRVLLSGHLVVDVWTKTNIAIAHSISRSQIAVLPPIDIREMKSDGSKYPPLGSYGPNNEGLPDISSGWHIFADGNMWCAVGPAYEDLQQSPAGFGPTPHLAYKELLRALGREGVLDLVNKPDLSDFQIHQPTVAPDGQ